MFKEEDPKALALSTALENLADSTRWFHRPWQREPPRRVVICHLVGFGRGRGVGRCRPSGADSWSCSVRVGVESGRVVYDDPGYHPKRASSPRRSEQDAERSSSTSDRGVMSISVRPEDLEDAKAAYMLSDWPGWAPATGPPSGSVPRSGSTPGSPRPNVPRSWSSGRPRPLVKVLENPHPIAGWAYESFAAHPKRGCSRPWARRWPGRGRGLPMMGVLTLPIGKTSTCLTLPSPALT